MATQTVTQRPHVVQFPQSVSTEEISQQELIHLIEARNTLDALKKHVETLESGLKTRLESQVPVQAGVHVASLREAFRRSVAWREVSEGLADQLYGIGKGEPYCESVLASTQPTRTLSLVVK